MCVSWTNTKKLTKIISELLAFLKCAAKLKEILKKLVLEYFEQWQHSIEKPQWEKQKKNMAFQDDSIYVDTIFY